MRYSRNSEQYISLRKWLVAKRHKSGMTTRALAEELGLSHTIVAKIELGERKLEAFEFIEYCRALDVGPEEGFKTMLDILNKKHL